MKKTLLIAALFFTFQSIQSQGNLQFNKIIHITFGPVNIDYSNTPTEIGTFTIAENKVYKVSIAGYAEYGSNPNPLYVYFKKNEESALTYSSNSLSTMPRQVFLLDVGTYKLYGQHNIGTTNIPSYITVNGTEFNIITE